MGKVSLLFPSSLIPHQSMGYSLDVTNFKQ